MHLQEGRGEPEGKYQCSQGAGPQAPGWMHPSQTQEFPKFSLAASSPLPLALRSITFPLLCSSLVENGHFAGFSQIPSHLHFRFLIVIMNIFLTFYSDDLCIYLCIITHYLYIISNNIFISRLKKLLILQVLFELPKQIVKLKKRQLLVLPPMWYARSL